MGMDTKELLKALREAIEAELSFVEYAETPIVWNMLQDEESKKLLIKEIERRVIKQKVYISRAIVQIDDE